MRPRIFVAILALMTSALCAQTITWPSGGAGIPNYTGSDSWGTSYNASDQQF
jgi:hypothetical protein